MQAIEKQVLDKFKALLQQRLPRHQIILFGSRARGDAEPYSDLDVLVLIDGVVDEAIREWVSDCAWEAGYAQGLVIVPVVFSRTQWEQGPERYSLLAQAVASEGIPL
ncbi:MAG: nucleotidyltransferase domain-containing protein [Deltaproteobacteria bacterium]|nr:nucleotidyltransferase domain-containing protein [Deltaproteobacteria bacterium]